MALPSGYRPQLDALRTIAVVLVALHHWEEFLIAGLHPQLGFLGVAMFFVLSGYLITGILIGVNRKRTTVAAGLEPVGIGGPIVAFYIRRFLRLFPAYYFFLFATWISGILTWDGGLGWYLAYATNFKIVRDGWLVPVSHLWTLAVEEQFYLLAPLAVLGLRRRNLVALMVATVVVGLSVGPRLDPIPPAAFVGLLVGCLLALAADHRSHWADLLGRVWPAVFVAWVGVYVLSAEFGHENRLTHAAFRLLCFVAMAGLIWRAANGYRGMVGAVLEWGPIVWLGKLSYGLYLWHTVAKDVTVYVGFDYANTVLPVRLAVASAATIAVTFISWRIVERPFLGLKDRFPYLPDHPTLADDVVGDYASSP